MNKKRLPENKPKNLKGFSLGGDKQHFLWCFKSGYKRKAIKNVEEYEQGNWIHAQAASLSCLWPSCADRPVHSVRLAEKGGESVQQYPSERQNN